MSRQFGRVARAIVGKPGQPGRLIDGLRISFKVTKDDGSVPNTAEVKVWNLGPVSQAATREPNSIIQLFAGYGEQVPLLFLGAITGSKTESDGTDVITTIRSGKATTGTGALSQTFKGQQGLKDMLGKASEPLEALGLDLEAVTDTKINAPRGVVLSGDPTDVLNKLTRANNLDWFIEDGTVRVVPKGQSTQEAAYILSPQSGLVGSPKALKPSGNDDGNRLSVEVKASLNAALRVRRILQVSNTDDLAGWYQIRKVEHVGDIWGDDWFSTCECSPVQSRV